MRTLRDNRLLLIFAYRFEVYTIIPLMKKMSLLYSHFPRYAILLHFLLLLQNEDFLVILLMRKTRISISYFFLSLKVLETVKN